MAFMGILLSVLGMAAIAFVIMGTIIAFCTALAIVFFIISAVKKKKYISLTESGIPAKKTSYIVLRILGFVFLIPAVYSLIYIIYVIIQVSVTDIDSFEYEPAAVYEYTAEYAPTERAELSDYINTAI